MMTPKMQQQQLLSLRFYGCRLLVQHEAENSNSNSNLFASTKCKKKKKTKKQLYREVNETNYEC